MDTQWTFARIERRYHSEMQRLGWSVNQAIAEWLQGRGYVSGKPSDNGKPSNVNRNPIVRTDRAVAKNPPPRRPLPRLDAVGGPKAKISLTEPTAEEKDVENALASLPTLAEIKESRRRE